MTTITIGPFVAGEIPAPLEYTFLDADGDPLAVIDGDATFVWTRLTDVPEAVTRDADFDVPTATATYTWVADDFPTGGQYRAELWVGNGTNRFASILLEYEVRDSVGAVPAV